jgi:hypothetical protein
MLNSFDDVSTCLEKQRASAKIAVGEIFGSAYRSSDKLRKDQTNHNITPMVSDTSANQFPKVRSVKRRRNSLPAPTNAGMRGQRGDPRHKRGSVTRSFENILVKGPVISEEARSKLIVRKQYNPHNTLSNLWLGSAVKLVFYHFRPWALTAIHIILLFLWSREVCQDNHLPCKNATYPFRESVQQFEISLSELGSAITMCLLVLTFYCNTCINIYRELYFTLTTISARMKNLCMFLYVFEDDLRKRWAIIR